MIPQVLARYKQIFLPLSMTFTNELPTPHAFNVAAAGF
jgi:hypothetical protein